MEKPKDLLFLEGISCLSFNKDCSSNNIILNPFSVCFIKKGQKFIHLQAKRFE